jgi:NADH-quinone oxidoreductase subunit H
MKWLRALVPVAVALVFAFLVSGRGTGSSRTALELIQVKDLAPRDVERGDRIGIVGTGFPAGKSARVTFRGTLRRPGEKALASAEVVLPGVAVGPEEVEIAVNEPAEALFCGAGDRALHTTFEGDVEVAFSAAIAGTAPIAGTLHGVTLDVRPSATAAALDGDAEGLRVLAFLGMRVVPNGGGAGLRVESVDPGSRAQAAGIAEGDVLAAFDGVRVGATGDVVPAAGEREAIVGVRRAGSPNETTRALAVAGLRRSPPTAFLGSALFIVSAIALVLLFCAPLPGRMATWLAHAASRQAEPATAATSARSRLAAAWARASAFVAQDVAPPRSGRKRNGVDPGVGQGALADAAAYAALAVMPLGQYVVAARLDVALLFSAATLALVGASFLDGFGGRGERSLWRGAQGAFFVAVGHLPAAAALASVVVMTGSLRIQEIERAQGAWPWEWLAFRDPAALVSFALFVSVLVAARDGLGGPPGSGRTAPASGLAALVLAPPAAPPRSGAWIHTVLRVHRILFAGLAAVLFLGGWALPGLSPAQQDARPALQLLGDLWLLGKTVAVVGFVSLLRWALPLSPRAGAPRIAGLGRALLPTLLPLAALALTFAWSVWNPPRAQALLVSSALVAVVALLALAFAQRLWHGMTAAGRDRHVSPFL